MIRSKSIQVLKTLSKEEFKQFGEFVRSTFFNKNQNLIKLFDVLRKYHPEYEIENEKVYSKIYPGKGYNHNNMKKLMAEMFIILEKFLLQIKTEKEKFNSDIYLLEEYMQRNLNELFLFKAGKINEKSEGANAYIYNFYDKFHFEDLIIQFYSKNNLETKIPMNTLLKKSKYAVSYFLENLLSDIVDIESLRSYWNKFEEDLMSESFLKFVDIKAFLKYLSGNGSKNNFLIFQVNLILMYIYPENETYFKQAKEFLLNVSQNIINENYKSFWQYYQFLENYCNMMNGKGKEKYKLEQFEVYKHHFKIFTKAMDENTKVESIFFYHLVTGGIKQNELKWAEEFMGENKKYLEEKDKENTYNYCKALLEFKKCNYEEALNYASVLAIRTDYYLKIQVNVLILKCYYELSLYDAAFSLIDSSKHYLSKTDELNPKNKEFYKLLLSVISKLLRLKINPDKNAKSDLVNLKSEVLKIPHKWYLEKVEELDKSITITKLPGKQNKRSQNKKLLKTA